MATKNIFGKKNNSGKIPVIVLIGGVLLSGIVSSFVPDDAGETSSADAIIAEATPVPGSRVSPVLEPTETPAPAPTVTPIVSPVLEPTAVPTSEPASDPTAAPTPEPAPEPTAAPTPEPTPTVAPTPNPTPNPTAAPTLEPAPVTDPEPNSNIDRNNTDEFTYVLNTRTHKIHHPGCRSVPTIKPENYATTDKSVDELLEDGYTKCGNCW